MKRVLLALLLSGQVLLATVISGKISDLTGQTMSSNRTVVFTLMNCGNNIPRIVGSSVVTPASKTVTPNPAGLLTGTIVGNDILECGTTIGQTYYKVQIYTGTQETYNRLFYISGPTWNLSTAIPLSNDPTAFMNFSGYLLGDLIYGAGTNVLGLVRGNISPTPKYLTQAGDGVNSGQPYWSDVHLNAIDIDSLSAGDYSAKITTGSYPGITVGQVTNGVYTTGNYPDPSWISSLSKTKVGLGSVENTALSTWPGSGNITAIGTLVSGNVPWARLSGIPSTFAPATHAAAHVTGAGDPLSGTLAVSITGNAATVTNGLYSSSTYTDPAWLTLTKAKVGLSAVENTALSTWIGSANITTLGTIGSGLWQGTAIADAYIASAATWNAKMSPLGYTPENAANKGAPNGYAGLNGSGQIPAAQLAANAGMTALVSDIAPQLGGNLDLNAKSIFGHLLFVSDNVNDIGAAGASRPRSIFVATSVTAPSFIGNASTVTDGVYTTGSYPDPAWLTISKAKVGLSAVENTALSGWAGSSNVTTIGTLIAGTVPWARLSNIPTTFAPSAHTHPLADMSTVGDWSSKITSGTYSINITGTAAPSNAPVIQVSTATYTVTAVPNTYILANAAANNVAVTLFTAVGNSGAQVTVKRVDSSAFTLTITGTSAQTMDGQASIQVPRQYDSVTFLSNGTNWSII